MTQKEGPRDRTGGQETTDELPASIRRQPEPAPLCLLEVSDLLDSEMSMRLQAFRDGWRAAELAHADDYDLGYVAGLLRRKHIEHSAVDAAKVCARRWELRGESRTRRTFGQPHPDDFAGRGAA